MMVEQRRVVVQAAASRHHCTPGVSPINTADPLGADQSMHKRSKMFRGYAVDQATGSASEIIIRIVRGIVVAGRPILRLHVLVSLDLHAQILVEVAGNAQSPAPVDLAIVTAGSGIRYTGYPPVRRQVAITQKDVPLRSEIGRAHV